MGRWLVKKTKPAGLTKPVSSFSISLTMPRYVDSSFADAAPIIPNERRRAKNIYATIE
jgi:hypothetical protein